MQFAEKLPEKDEDKIQFYLDYCSIFLPKDILKKCKIVDDEGIGLIGLFNHLWQFTQMPEDYNEPKGYLKVDTQIYGFSQNSLSTALKPLDKCTFEEFEEATAVMDALGKLKDPNYLALLVAIFYRPLKGLFNKKVEDYDTETVEARAELFKTCLTMDDVWNCYFFLQSQMSNSVKDMVTYLKAEAEKLGD